jgi:hypothetical protein
VVCYRRNGLPRTGSTGLLRKPKLYQKDSILPHSKSLCLLDEGTSPRKKLTKSKFTLDSYETDSLEASKTYTEKKRITVNGLGFKGPLAFSAPLVRCRPLKHIGVTAGSVLAEDFLLQPTNGKDLQGTSVAEQGKGTDWGPPKPCFWNLLLERKSFVLPTRCATVLFRTRYSG